MGGFFTFQTDDGKEMDIFTPMIDLREPACRIVKARSPI